MKTNSTYVHRRKRSGFRIFKILSRKIASSHLDEIQAKQKAYDADEMKKNALAKLVCDDPSVCLAFSLSHVSSETLMY